MRIFHDWRDLPPDARGATVALGNFDGVHRGHAEVIKAAHAARPKVPLAVLTFEPHPREHFRPDDPPFRLTLSAERADALAALGVTLLYELRFDHYFSLMSAEAFVGEVLHQGLGAKHLVCGPDFAFGRRRGGGTDFLAQRAEALGMGLTLVPLLADAAGHPRSQNQQWNVNALGDDRGRAKDADPHHQAEHHHRRVESGESRPDRAHDRLNGHATPPRAVSQDP